MKRKQLIKLSVPALLLLAAILIIVTVFLRQPVSYSLVAETERVGFTVAADRRQPVFLTNAVVRYIDPQLGLRDYTGAAVSFDPAAGARALFRRVGHGRIELSYSPPIGREGESTGQLERYNDNGTASERVNVMGEIAFIVDAVADRFRAGEPVRVPIEVEPGREPTIEFGSPESVGDPEAQPLLIRAQLTLLGRTIIGSSAFVGGTFDLRLGDRLEFHDASVTGVGMVLAGDRPGFSVTYRTVASAAWVTSYRTAGYAITLSRFQRVLNDHTIQGVWAVVLAMLGWAGKLSFDSSKKKPVSEANDEEEVSSETGA